MEAHLPGPRSIVLQVFDPPSFCVRFIYGTQVGGIASLASNPVVPPPSLTEMQNSATCAGRSRFWPLHASRWAPFVVLVIVR